MMGYKYVVFLLFLLLLATVTLAGEYDFWLVCNETLAECSAYRHAKTIGSTTYYCCGYWFISSPYKWTTSECEYCPCNSNYTSCDSAYDFGTLENSSSSESNLCSDSGQYFKVSTPSDKKCTITWTITPAFSVDYDLYVKWSDTCPSISDYDCRSKNAAGTSDSCTSTYKVNGTSIAYVKYYSGKGTYHISVTVSDCEPLDTTPPSTSISPNGKDWTRNDVSFSLACSDSQSGCAETRYSIISSSSRCPSSFSSLAYSGTSGCWSGREEAL